MGNKKNIIFTGLILIIPSYSYAGFGSTGFAGIGQPMGVSSGGLSQATADTLYIRLNGSNTPTTGNISIGKRIDFPTMINNVGFKIPTVAGACANVTGSVEGDMCWDTVGNTLYVHDGMDFVSVSAIGGPWLQLDAGNDPVYGDLDIGYVAGDKNSLTIEAEFDGTNPITHGVDDPGLILRGIADIDGGSNPARQAQILYVHGGGDPANRQIMNLEFSGSTTAGAPVVPGNAFLNEYSVTVTPTADWGGGQYIWSIYNTVPNMDSPVDGFPSTEIFSLASYTVGDTASPHITGLCDDITPGATDKCYYYGMSLPRARVDTDIFLRSTFLVRGNNTVAATDHLFSFGTEENAGFDIDDHLVSFTADGVETAYIRADGGAYFDGAVHIAGKLTVDGAIDPPSMSLSGGTALYYESADGSTAAVAPANKGRLRYLDGTGWQASANGGAWSTLGTSGNAFIQNGNTFGATAILGTNDANNLRFETNNIAHTTLATTGQFALQPGAVRTSGSPGVLIVHNVADTTLTAGVGATDVLFDLSADKEFSTGAITNQRAFWVLDPTYSFVAASTITNAATVSINGPPSAGTNATITNAYSLWVESGNSKFSGDIFAENGTFSQDIAVNGGDITSTVGTFNLLTAQDTLHIADTVPEVGPQEIFLGTSGSDEGNLYIFGNSTVGCQFSAVDVGGFIGQEATLTCSGNLAASRQINLTTKTLTGLTATNEYNDMFLDVANTKTFATGAITTQRAIRISNPTYAFSGASTITNAATMAIAGAPIAGTNATITNAYALWVQAGDTQLEGNVAINGGNLTTTAASFNLLDTNITTGDINFGGSITTGNINIGSSTMTTGDVNMGGGTAGGTGCTMDGGTGDFTCNGTISGSGGLILQKVEGDPPAATCNSANEAKLIYVQDTNPATNAGGVCVCIDVGSGVYSWVASVPAPSTGCP